MDDGFTELGDGRLGWRFSVSALEQKHKYTEHWLRDGSISARLMKELSHTYPSFPSRFNGLLVLRSGDIWMHANV